MDHTAFHSPNTAKFDQASKGASPKRPLNDIETAAEVLSAAAALATRIEVLAERLCGPTSETTGLSSTADYPSGVFPRLAFDAVHARNRVGDAMRALSRIEDALP